MKKIFILIIILGALVSLPAAAQELVNDLRTTWRAKVTKIISEEFQTIPGLEIKEKFQLLEAEILTGPQKGKVISLNNDFLVLKEGRRFFVNHLVTMDGKEIYQIQDIDRRGVILFFLGLFIFAVLVFGRWQGLRSLIALAGSFFMIFYFLFPLLLKGFSPLLVGTLLSVAILVFALYVTHGVNKTSTTALFGTIGTVIFAVLLSSLAVKMAGLSGFTEDAAIYLNLNTGGLLNFQGLLLSAIIIGILGVLDDIAITQASVVREFFSVAPDLSRKKIYAKALQIGKEHVGALVNTLALAYTGASLPLLLLFFGVGESASLVVNREIFATEIIRAIIGSIAIILSVPITTGLAVFFLEKERGKPLPAGVGHVDHSHHH